VVFGFQVGQLTESECDQVRKSLVIAKEFVPAAFRKASFSDGLVNFRPRLMDGTKALVGVPSSGSKGYETPLFIAPLTHP
jgi:hypothetical protein